MQMIRAAFLLFFFVAVSLLAQKPVPAPVHPDDRQAPPEITPRPGASPSPSASPANPPKPVETPTPKVTAIATPPPAPTADSLSPADVQQALGLLKSQFVRPEALSDPELSRATLQGLLERLGPAIALMNPSGNSEPGSFYTELYNDRAVYIRPGDLTKDALSQIDAALKTAQEKQVKFAIFDLRATGMSGDFDLGAEVVKRFCPKGKPLFTLKKSASKPQRLFTSNLDPQFKGVLIVLVDESTSGAAEVIAATLRAQANAVLIGEKTSGQAYEYADIPLHGGGILRVAVSEVALANGATVPREGVKPDIAVTMDDGRKRKVLQLAREKGIAAVVMEQERARLNEAALVAGSNPEIDAFAAAQKDRNPDKNRSSTDTQLQRALDLITSISIYETKAAQKQP